MTVDDQKEEFGTQAEDTTLKPPNAAKLLSDVTQNTATPEPKRERKGEALLKINYIFVLTHRTCKCYLRLL